MTIYEKRNGVAVEAVMLAERRTPVIFFLCFWLFILSAVAFLDRTNVSVAGLQISREFGLENQHLGWIFFRWFYLYMVQVRELDLRASAYFTMLPFLCRTIFFLVGGALSDRLTRKHGHRTGRFLLASISLLLSTLLLITDRGFKVLNTRV
jgi:MFS family permease